VSTPPVRSPPSAARWTTSCPGQKVGQRPRRTAVCCAAFTTDCETSVHRPLGEDCVPVHCSLLFPVPSSLFPVVTPTRSRYSGPKASVSAPHASATRPRPFHSQRCRAGTRGARSRLTRPAATMLRLASAIYSGSRGDVAHALGHRPRCRGEDRQPTGGRAQADPHSAGPNRSLAATGWTQLRWVGAWRAAKVGMSAGRTLGA